MNKYMAQIQIISDLSTKARGEKKYLIETANNCQTLIAAFIATTAFEFDVVLFCMCHT